MKKAMCLGRWAAALVVLGLVVYPSAQAVAFTRDYAIFPLGIRRAGMGETGTADHKEIANTAVNPSLVSMMNSLQASWSHSEATFSESVEIRLDGGSVGGGYQWAVGESYTIGGGLVFSYAKERWGVKSFLVPTDDTIEWELIEQGYTLGSAVAVGYGDAVRLGAGINAKWAKSGNSPEDESRRMTSKATIFDAGLDLIVTLVDKADYKLAAAAGFAYFNFGGEVEYEGRVVFLPEGTGRSWSDPLEYRRYGLNVTFSSPSWAKANRVFGTRLSLLSIALNYDKLDRVSRFDYGYANRHMAGGELALLRILFLRAGTIRWNSTDYLGEHSHSDTTHGLGIAIPFRSYYFRFDYARRDIENYDTNQNRYGLIFDFAF